MSIEARREPPGPREELIQRYRRMGQAIDRADRQYLASLTLERCVQGAEDLLRSVDELGFRHDPPDYTEIRSIETRIARLRRHDAVS